MKGVDFLLAILLTCPSDLMHCWTQCCGSVTFWYFSGSTDPFVSGFQDVNKKIVFCFNFLKITSVFKDKKSLRSHITIEIKVFSYYFFCWMIEESGFVPQTNGSWRPKNIQILGIRIRNTGRSKSFVKRIADTGVRNVLLRRRILKSKRGD
jgi:hypothetical protein